MTKTVVSLEDVYFAFCSNQTVKKKAIVGLMLSSGMGANAISKLTLEDFVIACGFSYSENDDNVLNSLLKENPRKIVPCWHIESEHRITFNTPETTQLIFLYLKETFNNEIYNLNNECLFDKNETNISRNVTDFKNYLMKIKKIDSNYFRPKYLQNTFEKVCKEHIINMDETSKNNLIELFQGETDEDNPFYIQAMENIDYVRKYYIDLIPYLTVNAYDFDNQYELYKNTLEKQELDANRIIETYYDIHLKEKLDLNDYDELHLLKYANKIGDKELFINSENYLIKLFKKARVCLKLQNRDYFDNNYIQEIYSDITDAQKLSDDLMNSIKALNVSDIINVSDSELRKNIMKNVIFREAYVTPLTFSNAGKFISEILFKIIDEENII